MSRNKIAGILSLVTLGVLSLGILPSATVVAATAPPNLDKTLAAQEQLAADRPYDASVHNDHGNLLVLAGRHEEAADAYRRAIELAPDGTLARFNLGVLLQQSGRSREAQKEFQGLLDIDPEHARSHYQLGMLFQARKQRGRAIESYARAFAYDPELTFANVNPHIIDNDLATEALLVSRRYGASPSSEMPRLYGEPERIADLMLGPYPVDSEATEDDDDDAEAEVVRKRTRRRGARAVFGDDGDESVPELEDEPDSSGRRTLTSEDLDAGSTVGQVQGSSGRSTRRSSAGRSGRSVGGLSAVRPPPKTTTGGRGSDDGRTEAGGRGPRYIPGTPFSSGRQQLELLPPEPAETRVAVTAAR